MRCTGPGFLRYSKYWSGAILLYDPKSVEPVSLPVQILHAISPVVEDGLSVLAEYLAHHHGA